MAWWKLFRARKPKPPPPRYHSGAWLKRGGYTGTKPGSELAPPIEWAEKQ